MTSPDPQPPDNDVLEHALALARCGLRVVPILPGTRHPPMLEWQNYASSNLDNVRGWFTGMWRIHRKTGELYGVGIVLGRQEDGRNLFAVDLDRHTPDADGYETILDLEQANTPLPDTVQSLTPRNGTHLIYDSGPIVVTNGNRLAQMPGIDVRGQDGQICVAPTIHDLTGTPYLWEHGHAPWEHEIAKAPDWLLELVANDRQQGTNSPAPQLERIPSNDSGSTDSSLADSPLDQLRATWDWPTELANQGWQHHKTDRNGDTTWTRPGKNVREGASGVLHGEVFNVFTTDASTTPMWQAGVISRGGSCVSLSPGAYYAAYHHAGSLSDATRALRQTQQPTVLGPVPETGEDATDDAVDDGLPVPIDWDALFARTNDVAWLIEDVWPLGRQLHIFAARKTGKSLVMLWFAANIAAGRDPLTGRPQPRQIVVYLDYEMSEDDLLERIEEMGFVPDDLRGWLLYYLWPVLPPLDTEVGGIELLRMLERDQAIAVILDTVSRVVQGEENSADTFRAFYNYTGKRLKRAGISLARLDHEGHEAGRSRGSSAKHDDVDVIWRLQMADGGGLTLLKKQARMSWIPEKVELERIEPLGYRQGVGLWPAGTKEKANELDELGIPIDTSKRDTIAALKVAGRQQGNTMVLMKAIQYRRQMNETLLGTTPGTGHTFDVGHHVGNQNKNPDLPAGTTTGTTGNQEPPSEGVWVPLFRGHHPDADPEFDNWSPTT